MSSAPVSAPLVETPAVGGPDRPPLAKKVLVSDHPTWCPGCGDFDVLASFYKVLEKLNYPQESIVTFSGIGCSSRIPYFVNSYGGHFIHGRSLPFSAAIFTSSPTPSTSMVTKGSRSTMPFWR